MQRDAPEISLRVENIESARLFNRAAKVDPLAELPIIVRPRRPIRTGQGRDEFDIHLRTLTTEDRHLVAELAKLSGQKPRPGLDAPAGILAYRS